MKNTYRFSLVLFWAFLSLWSYGQGVNLLEGHNADFQNSNASWLDDNMISSDYTYDNSYHGLQTGGVESGSGKFAITAQANNANGSFYMCSGHPSNHTNEKFLAVNGFGGTRTYTDLSGTPSNKKIIRYTVTGLLPNVYYDFSFWGTNLSNGTHLMAPHVAARVRFRVTGNGTQGPEIFEPTYTQDVPVWTLSPTYRFQSNSDGRLVITIYDDCEFVSGYGDDFGIDDVRLVMADGYIVNASPIALGSHCLCAFDDGIFVFDLPNGPNGYQCYFGNTLYTPTFYLKDTDGVFKQPTLQNPIATPHGGHAWFNNNHKLCYEPAPGYFGQENLEYKISKWGMEEASTINFSIRDLPTFVQMNANTWPEDDLLCVEDMGSFNPMATWESNGANLFYQGWQWKHASDPDEDGYWEESNSFSAQGVGDYTIRFMATNSCTDYCGFSPSQNLTLHVSAPPVLSTSTITQPPTLCGQSAALPNEYLNQVSVTWPNNVVGNKYWQVSHNGGANWIPMTETSSLQNGDLLQYIATNVCGSVMTNSVTVTIADGAEFTQNTPALDWDEFCINDVLSLNDFPTPPSYNSHGLNVENAYWAYSVDGESFTPLTGDLTLTQAGSYYFCYQLRFQCGSDIGFSNSPNPFQVTVHDVPSILVPEETPVLDTVCAGTSLASVLPEGFSPAAGSYYTASGWEISAGTSPDNYSTDLPSVLSASDHGRWIRFYAEGCGSPATSEPMQLFVGDKPTLNVTSAHIMSGFCDQTSVTSMVEQGKLTDVHVIQWNLFEHPEDLDDPSYERWEVLVNNVWTPFTVFSMEYNGCQIRYHAHNRCDDTYAYADDAILVTAGPEFTNPNLYASLESHYCASNDILALPVISDSDYNTNGLGYPRPYWAWSPDGVEFVELENNALTLSVANNGFLRCYLDSDECGGAVAYTLQEPFPLTIIGSPEIQSVTSSITELCEGEVFEYGDLLYEVDWSHGSDEGSSWQYASEVAPNNYSSFDPFSEPLPVGINHIRYYAENECFHTESNILLRVVVNQRPGFVESIPFTLGSFCANEPLDLPATPSLMGLVESSGWQISLTQNQNGEYTDELPAQLTMADQGKWLRYYAQGCETTVHFEAQLFILEKPVVKSDVGSALCTGQLLSYTPPVSLNGVTEFGMKWRKRDAQGTIVEFNPDTDPFDVAGDYEVSYAAYNECSEMQNLDYSEWYLVSVTDGPQYQLNPAWPTSIEVCAGVPLSTVIEAYALSEPPLVNPDVESSPMGWFVSYLDEAGMTQYELMNLGQVITEDYDNRQLCYGMKGYCSDIPIYSVGIPFEVHGRPEIVSLNVPQYYCSGDVFPPVDAEVTVNAHNNEYESQWQWFDGERWTEIPNQSFVIANEHDGLPVRYMITPVNCGFESDISEPFDLYVAGVPEILEGINETISVCADGALGDISPEVNWHNSWPEEGVWQVSNSENGTFGTGPFGSDGIYFNPYEVSELFDGWYLRYHVEGCGDENNSNIAQIDVLHSATVEITGSEQVAQMNSYWPGVYIYHTDVQGGLNWTLEPEIWEYSEVFIDGKSCCRIVVTTTGQASLSAKVGDGSCGMDVIEINASQFDVEDQQIPKAEIYPNPAQHSVTVVSEDIDAVIVYDLLGQPLKTFNGNGSERVTLTVGDLAEALYLVEIRTGKVVIRKMLTVVH